MANAARGAAIVNAARLRTYLRMTSSSSSTVGSRPREDAHEEIRNARAECGHCGECAELKPASLPLANGLRQMDTVERPLAKGRELHLLAVRAVCRVRDRST